MVKDRLIGKDEVKRLLATDSDFQAYKIMRELNRELQEQGYRTIQGKVSLAYLVERYLPGGVDELETE